MNKKGFTLIEVLAVLVIMAIILTLAVPNIFKFRSNANEKAFRTKIDLLATTAETYIENNSNDIVYKCNNGLSGCVCEEFYNNTTHYTCVFKIGKLVDLGLYNESCKKQDEEQCACSISNPKNDSKCLANEKFEISFDLNSNTAHATYIENR